MLRELAEAALAVLSRHGERSDGGRNPGDGTWRFEDDIHDGMRFEISCTGPDLPTEIPGATIPPAEIPNDPDWQGAYRLVVAPPLIALDIAWNAGEPLRIMTFSRGDWEGQLRARAG